MKKIFVIIGTVMAVLISVFAQGQTKKGTFKINGGKLAALAALPSTAMMYRGVENPVKVLVSGASMKGVSYKVIGGEIKRKNLANDSLFIEPAGSKDSLNTLTLEVYARKKLIHQQVFKIKSMPRPKAKFAGVVASGVATLSKVRAAAGIIADVESFYFEGIQFKVVSFTLSTVYKGNPVEAKILGNKVTGSNARTILLALKSGSKLYVEDIKAESPAGVVSLGGIKIKIM